MGKPAARVSDMHTCPMVNPGPVPHVGGPVMPPGCPTVFIAGMPAARVGDMATCTGPPDSIVMGSIGVFIGGMPAARMGDNTAHGGVIVAGCPTVFIGEVAPVMITPMVPGVSSSVAPVPLSTPAQRQAVTFKEAAKTGTPFCEP